MNLDFSNAESLAHAVADVADMKLTPRPYNRFTPDETIWWLVPSGEYPAFKFGKLFFDSHTSVAPEDIFCGFYLEKGASPALKGTLPDSWLMEPDWLWSDFIAGMNSVLFSFPADSMIIISAGLCQPPRLQDERDRTRQADLERSQIIFRPKKKQRIGNYKSETQSGSREHHRLSAAGSRARDNKPTAVFIIGSDS